LAQHLRIILALEVDAHALALWSTPIAVARVRRL
jgi:hypothetical protein